LLSLSFYPRAPSFGSESYATRISVFAILKKKYKKSINFAIFMHFSTHFDLGRFFDFSAGF